MNLDDVPALLREAARLTVLRLRDTDFIDTVNGWDVYVYRNPKLTGGAVTIALRLIGEEPARTVQIGAFLPGARSLEEIRGLITEV